MSTNDDLARWGEPPTDVDELRPKLDGMPVVSDAFYSPAHNLVVLSPMRLDEAGKSFSELAKAKYQEGWSRDELLKGKAPVVKGGNFADASARQY